MKHQQTSAYFTTKKSISKVKFRNVQ